MRTALTELLNSTSLRPINGLAPTVAERAAGRFMRAPDHDAGTGAGDAGVGSDAGAGDGGGGGKAGADAGSGDGNAQGSDTGADAGDAGKGDDATVLGSATAKDGAGDGKGDGEKAKADDKGDDDGDAGVPEAYDLKVTTKDAEGKETEVEIDTDLLAEATPVLKELKLTNDQANKLAPFVTKAIEKAFTKQADDYATVKADWAKQAQADAEIGGKNWKTTQTNAARALDHFAGPVSTKGEDGKEVPNAFRALLNESGLGNHPDMIRAFSKIGEALGEDGTFARSDIGTKQPKSREEALYPDDVPKK